MNQMNGVSQWCLGWLATILSKVSKGRGCLLGALLLFSAGCSSSGGVLGFLDLLTSPTPGQTAREAFNVHDADIRRLSVMRLASASFGGEEPYLRLYRLLVDDDDATVRAACVRAIGLHGTVADVGLILVRLKDEDAFVRWESVQALQKIHDPIAVGPLIKIVNEDSDADVRMAAAAALGQYAEMRVYHALVGALDDRSFGVVEAASGSLKTLTGYNFGFEGPLWLMWVEKRGGTLFDDQQPYVWHPYVKPRGLIDKMMFWKRQKETDPMTPKGLAAPNEAQQDSAPSS